MELSLVLDCETRWCSMYEMIEWFICLKKCMSKALLDLSIEHDISTVQLNWKKFSNFYFLSRRRASQALRKI